MRLLVIEFLLLFSFSFYQVESLNILGVFPYEGKSHFFVFEPFLRELAKRGHNLTVISYFPQQKPTENYHDISLAGKSTVLEGVVPLESSYSSMINIILFLLNAGTVNCKVLLQDENVQQLWKTSAKFDVILVEQFQSDCALGLAHKLGGPVVGLTSHMFAPWHYEKYGIKYNPSYMPFMFLGGGTKPTFYQRIERFIFANFFQVVYKHWSQKVDEVTLAQYFDDLPSLDELSRNLKILLFYQHPALTGSALLPSNIKPVAGYHVAKPKELPTDLKKFIDESEHGVIYISFGSMVKASTTPRSKVEAIIGALSELPQRVIWKWEEKELPGNPKNIYLSNWLPQNDILAHPNIVAFYSHCGLLGTTEAIQHGVPMVVMPVFGDQPGNAGLVVESGLGVQILITELTKELLLEKFKTVLDPTFRAQVKKLSKVWHDRPMSAMDTAVYWTEFAARHRDYSLKLSAAEVPFYQYYGLDILSVFLGIPIVLIVLVKLLISSKSTKTQVNEKKKRV